MSKDTKIIRFDFNKMKQQADTSAEFVEDINNELQKLKKLSADYEGDFREAFEEHGEEE